MTTLTTLAIVLAVYAACISVDSGVEGRSPRVRPSGVSRMRHSRSMGFDPESEKTCGLGCMVKANSQCVAIVRAIRRFKKSAALPIGDGDYQSVPSLYRNSTCPAMCAEEASRDCQDKIREVVQATCPIDDDCDEDGDSIRQSLQRAQEERDAAVRAQKAEAQLLADAVVRANAAEGRANESKANAEKLQQQLSNLQDRFNALKASCEGEKQAEEPAAAAVDDTSNGQKEDSQALEEEQSNEPATECPPERHTGYDATAYNFRSQDLKFMEQNDIEFDVWYHLEHANRTIMITNLVTEQSTAAAECREHGGYLLQIDHTSTIRWLERSLALLVPTSFWTDLQAVSNGTVKDGKRTCAYKDAAHAPQKPQLSFEIDVCKLRRCACVAQLLEPAKPTTEGTVQFKFTHSPTNCTRKLRVICMKD